MIHFLHLLKLIHKKVVKSNKLMAILKNLVSSRFKFLTPGIMPNQKQFMYLKFELFQ